MAVAAVGRVGAGDVGARDEVVPAESCACFPVVIGFNVSVAA